MTESYRSAGFEGLPDELAAAIRAVQAGSRPGDDQICQLVRVSIEVEDATGDPGLLTERKFTIAPTIGDLRTAPYRGTAACLVQTQGTLNEWFQETIGMLMAKADQRGEREALTIMFRTVRSPDIDAADLPTPGPANPPATNN